MCSDTTITITVSLGMAFKQQIAAAGNASSHDGSPEIDRGVNGPSAWGPQLSSAKPSHPASKATAWGSAKGTALSTLLLTLLKLVDSSTKPYMEVCRSLLTALALPISHMRVTMIWQASQLVPPCRLIPWTLFQHACRPPRSHTQHAQ